VEALATEVTLKPSLIPEVQGCHQLRELYVRRRLRQLDVDRHVNIQVIETTNGYSGAASGNC